jgi:polar amino acid transport system ATP-binding protein
MNLKVAGLSKEYSGQEAISRISFDVKDISVLALIGPSGGGKSTLLKILAGLIKPESGHVELNNQKLVFEEAWLHEYRKTIGVVFQSYNLFPHISAFRNITLPLEVVHKVGKKEAEEKADAFLEKFSLKEHAHKKPYELSGGQQQRIAIARSMAMGPQCLMLDEPTSALDPSLTMEVLGMISQLKDKGTNIIMVTHEIAFAKKAADYVLYLDNGRLVEQGYSRSLFESPQTEELKCFLKNIL